VLSRIIGEVKGRHVGPQIVRLVGETFGIPGPWPDEEYSLLELGCEWDDIAARWSVATGTGRPLDDRTIAAFYPRRLWPAFWQVILLGPVAATRTIESTLHAAAHGLTLDGDPRPGGALSALTIDSLGASFGRLTRAIIELRKQSLDPHLGLDLPGEFTQWTRDTLPRRRTAIELGARLQRRNNTKAVSLRLARLALQSLDAHIRQNQRSSYRFGKYLRNRALLGILLLGPRIGTVAWLRAGDYDRSHRFPDGTVGPALRFRRLKGLPGLTRWRGIPAQLADWIDEYFEYFELQANPDAPFWITKRGFVRQLRQPTTVTLSCAVVACFQRVQSEDDTRSYRPHSLRHLAEQVCFAAAVEYLTEHRQELLHDQTGRGLPANPQVLCDCLLDHALHDISDRYKDVNNEDGREIWSRFAAQLLWDYVSGDKGARRIPDFRGVRHARRALEHTHEQERHSRELIRVLEARRGRLHSDADRQLDSVLRELDGLDEAARWRAHFEQLASMREIASIDSEIKAEALRLADTTREVERAEAALERARTIRLAARDQLSEAEVKYLDQLFAALGESAEARTRSLTEAAFLSCFGGGLSEDRLHRMLRGDVSFDHLFDRQANSAPAGVTVEAGETLFEFGELPLERYHVQVVMRLEQLARRENALRMTKTT